MATEVDQMLAKSAAATGLSDWGDDTSFLVGLTQLVYALRDPGIGPAIRVSARSRILDLLTTRLRLVADERVHPEIIEAPIERPLILIGLARTGTTILHQLLSLDPGARTPLEWEASAPWPAPDITTYAVDRRIADAQSRIEKQLAAAPYLRAMHPWGAQLPAECVSFMTLHFASPVFWSRYSVPEYVEWLASCEPDGLYRSHRRVLQQLQWRGPKGRWTLKAPPHLLNLRQLLAVYPDSCLVQTHREPARTIPSIASLAWSIQRLLDPQADARTAGRAALRLYGAALERGTEAREDSTIDSRVLDIAYRDTVTDPVGTVRRIYDHFGFAFGSEHEERIHTHMSVNPQGRHGRHEYQASDFDLDLDVLARSFPTYRQRFGALLEEPA